MPARPRAASLLALVAFRGRSANLRRAATKGALVFGSRGSTAALPPFAPSSRLVAAARLQQLWRVARPRSAAYAGSPIERRLEKDRPTACSSCQPIRLERLSSARSRASRWPLIPAYSAASAMLWQLNSLSPIRGRIWFWGGSDLYPTAQLFWNKGGVNNFMAYLAGDIPVGSYSPDRLANIGIGHAAIDGGGAYTYLDTKTGTDFSATLGLDRQFRETRRPTIRTGSTYISSSPLRNS